jgi:hypothetical protein
MKYLVSIATLMILASCGVDGEPTQPTQTASSKPGITVTGRAEIGISRRSN